ncbi:hypothetical protein CNR22_08630 [Sphingobacteriaceae bacterium]|nr:hypothetical protein CNR22_08630 [Sphingobacteriaceae bacterium]
MGLIMQTGGGNEDKLLSLKKDFVLNAAFVLLILVILLTRVLIFFKVNLPCIDSDQPFMWAGVKDYSEGKFYEPRFYGQDYNTFLEALFAVPLYWLKVPVYYALPIATHFLSLFPFLFTAFYLFFHQRKENALLVLAVLLCLPLGYDIMSGIPRGFVSGLFFSSFFVISILNPQNLKWLFINSTLALTGYFVNPNSVLVSIPLLFYFFLMNYKNSKYYVVSLAALLWFIPLYFIFDYFYKIHPEYVVLDLHYNFTTAFFWDILKHLDRHFAHVNFFVEEKAISVLCVLLLIAIALFKENKRAFYALLCFLVVILLSFFSAKTKDGVVWPFYSYSRIFLGIPLFIAFASLMIHLRSRIIALSIIVVSLGFSAYKFFDFDRALDCHTKHVEKWNGVHLMSINSVFESLNFFKKKCKENKTEHFLISNTFWLCTYMNYGGAVIMKDFPSTEETAAERRYWVREGNKDKVFEKFIFLSAKFDFDKRLSGTEKFTLKRLDDYGLFLVENNKVSNKDFLSLVRDLERK